MARATEIKLVCFDLGGVVVRICRSWDEACAAAKIDVRDPATFSQPDLKAKRQHLVLQYQSGRISCDEFFDGIAAATGELYSAAEIRKIHCAWTRDDYPGVERLIRELHQVGKVQTACLSNTNHCHWQILRNGAGHEFGASRAVSKLRHHFVSHNLRAVKPDEQAFRPVEKTLNCLPTEVVFFDDTAENVDAAKSFGWNAHLIDHSGDTAKQMRSVLIRAIPHFE